MPKKAINDARKSINRGIKTGKDIMKVSKTGKKFLKNEAKLLGEQAVKGAAMKAIGDVGAKFKPVGNVLAAKAAFDLAKTIPNTGLTGIALRNRKDIMKAGKLAAGKKGLGNKVSTLGKGLLKVAAGVDPSKGKSTSTLLKKAGINAVKRIGKDTMTMLDAGSGIPGPLGLKIRGIRTGLKTGLRAAKSAIKAKDDIKNVIKMADKKKGAANRAGTLAKGLLKIAAGQDPKSKKSTKKLLKGVGRKLAQEPRKLLSTFLS